MPLDHLLEKLPAATPILQANFGLEREGLRITPADAIAQTPHPTVFGSRSIHPYIQTDFSEAQLELITPVATSTAQALRLLDAITDVTQRSLTKDEFIWPLSMPPRIADQEIQPAKLEDENESAYRRYLADKYGTKLQAISGIHYNFELGSDLMADLFAASGYTDLVQFKNDLYLKLGQNFLRYRFLLTYLYGASPIAEEGFYKQEIPSPVRSYRNSGLGYVNKKHIQVSYASLEDYIQNIEDYITSQDLLVEKEFYSAIRFRGQAKNRAYLDKGITYLEFRPFDINPFDHLGITQETMDTVHLMVLALLWMDSLENVDVQLDKAHHLSHRIALSHPLDCLPDEAMPAVQELLHAMQTVITHFQLGDGYQSLLERVKAAIADPSLTFAAQLLPHIQQSSLQDFGLTQARKEKDYAWQDYYALKGYEKMELSTQMLLFDVIQKGVHFEILDEADQFLKLWHQDHVEYVKNGNMTSKDNYVVPLAMANKTVTKKILEQAGFPVPAGAEFSQLEDALRYYPMVKDKAIVIKPKSTNFGLGIYSFL